MEVGARLWAAKVLDKKGAGFISDRTIVIPVCLITIMTIA
jgi:hypothetical protein